MVALSLPPPLLHTLILLPPPSGFKALAKLLESSWGQLPLPHSHLCVNGGRLLTKWARPSTPTSLLHLGALPPGPRDKPHQSVLRRSVFLLIKLHSLDGLEILGERNLITQGCLSQRFYRKMWPQILALDLVQDYLTLASFQFREMVNLMASEAATGEPASARL